MKVIICFGPVRVVVPCGDGELTVKELTERAVHRYIKTMERPRNVYVNVLNLKTFDNNALLDPSDRLKDVVDDKDQLVATFTLTENVPDHRNGDGMSGSSDGSPSPELHHGFGKDLHDFDPSTETIVTNRDMMSKDHKLIVRRCSEEMIDFPPACPPPAFQHQKASSLPVEMPGEISSLRNSRRKSTASPHGSQYQVTHKPAPQYNNDDDHISTLHQHNYISNNNNNNYISNNINNNINNNRYNFVRNDLKNESTSKQSTGRIGTNEEPRSNFRIIPLKSPDPIPSSDSDDHHHHRNQTEANEKSSKYRRAESPHHHSTDKHSQPFREKVVSAKDMLGIHTSNFASRKEKFVIELKKGTKGLGFSVTTQDNVTNEDRNLIFVKKILPSGSAIEDGRLRPGDCILEVNGVSMAGKAQEEVVAYLRKINVGESANLLIVRTPNSIYLPPNNMIDNIMPNNKFDGSKMDLRRNCSEGTSLSDLGRRKKQNQNHDRQDTDSIISSESESRAFRSRFTREGPGRRSMSEKRKGHVDPRTTETYGKIQNQRTEKKMDVHGGGSNESLVKRFVPLQPNYISSYEEILGGFRTRAINDSFRVAVDKCLDGGCSKNPSQRNRSMNSAQINEDQREKILKGFGNTLNFGNIKKSAESYKHVDNRPIKNHHDTSKASESRMVRSSPLVWR